MSWIPQRKTVSVDQGLSRKIRRVTFVRNAMHLVNAVMEKTILNARNAKLRYPYIMKIQKYLGKVLVIA
jgi:hypothetical protein